jgi:hypothetical protein
MEVDRVVVELIAKLDQYDARLAGAEQRFNKTMQGMQGAAQRTELAVARTMRNMER